MDLVARYLMCRGVAVMFKHCCRTRTSVRYRDIPLDIRQPWMAVDVAREVFEQAVEEGLQLMVDRLLNIGGEAEDVDGAEVGDMDIV